MSRSDRGGGSAGDDQIGPTGRGPPLCLRHLPRKGGEGESVGDLSGFVTERLGDTWIVRVGDTLHTIRFEDDSVIEAMLPIWTDGVEPGDYVVVGATDDNVNTFITTGIVIIPASTALTGDAAVEAILADANQ